MARRNQVWFRKRFNTPILRAIILERDRLRMDYRDPNRRDTRREAMWRVLLKNTPEAKLRRAGNPRIRRTFPRTGR